MSVINECLEGEKIYNILEWWSIQEILEDDNTIRTIERKIEIGEQLTFVDAYLDENNVKKPYAWLVKFKCLDGYVDDAAHINFVTEDEWNALKEYFYTCFSNKTKTIRE